MEVFYLFISLIFLAIYIFIDYFVHKLQNLPPRPWLPPLPIIGHLYLLRKPLHKSLAKHGAIQLLQFGSRRVLVVSSPSAAEECFTKNDIVFANRPRLLAGKYLGYNYTSLIFAPYGDHWRNLRHICSLEIFSSQRIRESEPIRADEVRLMLRNLYRSSSKQTTAVQVKVKAMFVDLTLNTVMRMVSGKRYCYSSDEVITDEEKDKAHNFHDIVDEILKVSGATNLGDYLPMLRWFGVRNLEKRLLSLQAKRDLFMKELLEELKGSMKTCGDGKQKNMIQMLLYLQKSEPESYTDEMIRSLMLVILASGTDTSITTMEWAMSLLLNNPSVLKKAQAEIDNCVGQNRCVEESDMCNLPYLGCIIKETMRMFPPGPLLPHESAQDCTVGGYHVPKGTMLLVNVWEIQNNPNIWDDPKTFRPERFEGLEGFRDIRFMLLPFGFGRRSCPGEGMAMRLMALGLGSLIQCFEWERTSENEVDMSHGTEGLSLKKAMNLVAFCRPRPAMLNLLSQL